MDDEVYITFLNYSTRWKITNLMLARMQSFGLKNAISQSKQTKDIVVNEAPFDEKLTVFSSYMLPLAKYIDTLHNVVNPENATS